MSVSLGVQLAVFEGFLIASCLHANRRVMNSRAPNKIHWSSAFSTVVVAASLGIGRFLAENGALTFLPQALLDKLMLLHKLTSDFAGLSAVLGFALGTWSNLGPEASTTAPSRSRFPPALPLVLFNVPFALVAYRYQLLQANPLLALAVQGPAVVMMLALAVYRLVQPGRVGKQRPLFLLGALAAFILGGEMAKAPDSTRFLSFLHPTDALHVCLSVAMLLFSMTVAPSKIKA